MVPNGWEIGKVNDLIQSLDAGTSVNAEDKNYGAEHYILKTSCISSGYFDSSEVKAVTDKQEIERLKEPLLSNSILISRMNTPALVGANAYIKKGNPNFYLPDRLWQVKIKEGSCVMKWLAYWLSADKTRYRLSELGSGTSGSMKNISKKAVLNLTILIPPLAEQEKIAEILSTWDQAIDSTEKLIANAELQKKALMQQLLTGKKRLLDENSERFSGKWEKVKLGDVATISKGVQRNRDTLTSTGDYPVINGGIEASGYTHEYNTEANTITISEGGNSCGYVSYQKGRFWCGGHCYFLTNISLNDLFLYQSLKLNELKIMNLRVGSGLPNIQKKAIDNFSFEYPIEIQEQQKIAEVLSTADREIELLTEKLEYLKAEKKALMQQLLTGKRRVKVA